MITKLYREYVPKEIRDKIYNVFLGDILLLIRQPQIILWYFKNRKTRKKILSFLPLIYQQDGLEIGGGTFLFSDHKSFPVYLYAKKVDGCNFSSETIWEGTISDSNYFYNGIKLGKQYICEATDVHICINSKYDFIISSNCLEHIANPLKAVKSWLQLLNNNGNIMLILPNKCSNFDHRRDYTLFNHLLEDYRNDVKEDDMTHFEEILNFHDLKMDVIKNRDQFIERSKDNYKNRCFHHHVFSENLLVEIFRFFNIDILYSGADFFNIYILGIKK